MPIALVIMAANFGCYRTIILRISVPHGGRVYVKYWVSLLVLIVYCYLFFVIVFLFFYEFCRRSLNFIRSCTSHESALIRFIAYYGVTFFRGFSVLGQNISFCTYRYDCSLFDLLYGLINNTVHSYVADSVSDINLCYGNFLTELIMIRDGILSISDNITTDELNIIIDFICTSQLAL